MNDFGKPVRKILLDGGCQLLRQGRGDHEVWDSPHTANGILRDAGLPKAF